MREEIEKIYYTLPNLMEDYKTLPETKASHDKFWEYMREHNIISDRNTELNMDILFCECEVQNERQGFIFGFEYAVRLLTCQKGGAL